jgi:hypothetical protein
MSDRLSRSMETALLCNAGQDVPLWSANSWTVATMRALVRRGYMRQVQQGKRKLCVVTRKGQALARRICNARRAES